MLDGVEADQQQADEDQNEREAHQHHHHPVLCNDSEEESKDAFYDQLQAELERTPCHEMKIVMGDLNAKVGSNNKSHDRAMGKEGCGSMNNNGERLLEFCD